MSDISFVELPHRGLVHIEGDDRVEFLQGLVSNDITQLEEQRIQYACLLTPQGKFLYDFFVHWGNGFILLDCEGGARAQDLYERLNKYRLRADVKISIEQNHIVYSTFDQKIGLPDPRHFKMGYRSFEKPDGLEESFLEWDRERILLGVPDGSRDIEVERSTMLECNLDKLNAIDWDKGCWMGQELTARMHHRNLGKKHLRALRFESLPPAPFTDIVIDGQTIGNMRSSCGNIGLAIIKDEALEKLKNENNDSLRLLG
jgi:folate-binding protein YgfZ